MPNCILPYSKTVKGECRKTNSLEFLPTKSDTHQKKETDNQGLMRIERMNQTGTKKEAYTSSTIKYQLKNSLNTLVAPTGIEPVYHA